MMKTSWVIALGLITGCYVYISHYIIGIYKKEKLKWRVLISLVVPFVSICAVPVCFLILYELTAGHAYPDYKGMGLLSTGFFLSITALLSSSISCIIAFLTQKMKLKLSKPSIFFIVVFSTAYIFYFLSVGNRMILGD